jgi:septal ring factor EnvC (AmiA/AmiB activator)
LSSTWPAPQAMRRGETMSETMVFDGVCQICGCSLNLCRCFPEKSDIPSELRRVSEAIDAMARRTDKEEELRARIASLESEVERLRETLLRTLSYVKNSNWHDRLKDDIEALLKREP